MTFEQKIADLCGRRRFGMRPGLERIEKLMDLLGHPERDFVAVHIAGTNGKGAVAAITSSVLSRAGFGKVGLYTSPHLVYFNERIRINGLPVSNDALESAYDELAEALAKFDEDDSMPTFFECVTALAFLIFRSCNVRVAVIETGLGGRLDATNVVMPVVSVITSIGLEHCEYLGSTLGAIAREKAGIVKSGRPVVTGGSLPEEASEEIFRIARGLSAPVFDSSVSLTTSSRGAGTFVSFEDSFRSISKIDFPLNGLFQLENLTTAINALEAFSQATGLPLSDDAFRDGISSTVWPCRFQVVRGEPTVIIDGAHNPPAALALRAALRKRKLSKNSVLVSGFCDDKDSLSVLSSLNSLFRRAVAVEIPSPRSLPAEKTAAVMHSAGFRDVEVRQDWKEGFETAKAWAKDNGGEVVVCGSLFLAGAVADYLGALPWSNGIKTSGELLKPI